jgi:hypothetical protein
MNLREASMGLWKNEPHAPQSMFDRLVAVEAKVARQQELNKAILAYVEADIASTWMSTARELSEALQKALEEE